MALERFRNRFGTNVVRVGTVVAATVAVATSVVVSPANAADAPSNRELLQSCHREAQYCEFHPQSYRLYSGPEHQVGGLAYNCATQTNPHQISWSDTTESRNTFGIAVTASVSFQKVFEVSVEASYGHEWATSHTDSVTETVNVTPKNKGWVVRGTGMQRATGWYELRYHKPFHGHNVWFVKNYEESGYAKDKRSYIVFHEAKMTDFDIKQHCHK